MGDIADDAYMHEYEGEFEELPQPPAPDAADSGETTQRTKLRSILAIAEVDKHNWTGNTEGWLNVTIDQLEQLIAAAVQAAQVELRESTYDALIRVANLHGPIPASNLELLKKAALLDGERRKEGGKDAGD